MTRCVDKAIRNLTSQGVQIGSSIWGKVML